MNVFLYFLADDQQILLQPDDELDDQVDDDVRGSRIRTDRSDYPIVSTSGK